MKRTRQQGFTLWEISFYLLFGFFMFMCAMKLGPHYVNDHNIASAIDSVHADIAGKDIYEITNADIKNRLSRYFQISMIPHEILKQLEVERTGGKVIVKLEYDAAVEFIGNVSILIHFTHEVDFTEPVK